MRVERSELERGSGGDGVVRSIRGLEPAGLSILSDRRRHGPAGAAGNEAGRPGRNELNGEARMNNVVRNYI